MRELRFKPDKFPVLDDSVSGGESEFQLTTIQILMSFLQALSSIH